MEIESTLKRLTYIKLFLLPFFRSFSFYVYVVFGVLFVVLGLVLNTWIWIYFTIAGLFAGISYYGWRILSRCYRQKYSTLFLKRTITFNNENVVVVSSAEKRIINWDAFIRWGLYAGCYYLESKNGSTILIPQDDILEEQKEEFVVLLRQKIDKTLIYDVTES